MSFTTTRAAVAAALTAALTALDIEVYARRPVPFAVDSAWVVLTLADTEDLTYGEAARVTYDVVFALGTDDIEAGIRLDQIAAPLITALSAVGRGVTIRPLTLTIDGSDIYCAVGTLITEVGQS